MKIELMSRFTVKKPAASSNSSQSAFPVSRVWICCRQGAEQKRKKKLTGRRGVGGSDTWNPRAEIRLRGGKDAKLQKTHKWGRMLRVLQEETEGIGECIRFVFFRATSQWEYFHPKVTPVFSFWTKRRRTSETFKAAEKKTQNKTKNTGVTSENLLEPRRKTTRRNIPDEHSTDSIPFRFNTESEKNVHVQHPLPPPFHTSFL